MLEYNKEMEFLMYTLSKEVQEAIRNHFTDERDIDVVTFTLEKVFSTQEERIILAVNKRIDQILYEIKFELSKQFATKSDLEALEARIEAKIAQLETKMEKRFSELEIKMEKRFSEVETKMEKRFSEVGDKISGLDVRLTRLETKIDSSVKTFSWIMGGVVALIGILSNLQYIIKIF